MWERKGMDGIEEDGAVVGMLMGGGMLVWGWGEVARRRL